jgi:hypothetical protein
MVLEVVLLETNHRGGEFTVLLLACVRSLDGCRGHDDPTCVGDRYPLGPLKE